MRRHEEYFFPAADGAQLVLSLLGPRTSEADRAIVLLHRGHEHSGRIMHLVDELDLPEFAMFAWDARGHGALVRGRIEPQSDALHLRQRSGSLSCATSPTRTAFRMENIAVIAQSVGGVLAATWVHDYAPKIRCLILATPAFKVKLYVPFARTGLGFASKFNEKLHVNSYVKAGALTHDPERIASYKADPLIQRPISVKVLLGLYSTADRVIDDAGAIQTPTQMLISGKRLGGAPEAAAPVLRTPGLGGEGAARLRRVSITTRWARRIATLPIGKARDVHRCACSRSRRCARRCSMPTSAATPGMSSTALSQPLPALSPKGRYRSPSSRCAMGTDGPALGRRPAGTQDRLRFRQHAGLRLSQPAFRRHADRQADRLVLREFDRLARHSRAQAEYRAAAGQGDGRCCARRALRCADGHRRGTRPLRAGGDREAAKLRPDSVLLRDYSDRSTSTAASA